MELVLNVLWALLALGILGVWRLRWVPQRQQSQRNSFAEWTALGCVLVLLFFAVSVTDDLHPEIALLVDRTASRRHAIVRSPGHNSVHAKRVISASNSAILQGFAPLESLGLIGRIGLSVNASPSLLEYGQFDGRAPPTFPL
jgi:hypothetical protein